jgi:hypothetical protein
MKKHLVLYGTDEFSGTIELLKDSVCDYVDQIHFYNRCDIDFDFYNKNKVILDQPRGNGYWIWKPYFILKTLAEINDDDFCLYLDVGMTTIRDINILFELCKINEGILLFENKNANINNEVWLNYMWTKYDCFDLMNCIDDKYIYGKQVDAAFQVYQKNKKSIDFLNEYLKYCEDEKIVTDCPNVLGENYSGFVDHRHDQSILSLLSIKYDLKLEHSPSHWGINTPNKKFKTLFYHHKRRMHFNEIFPNKL